MIVSLSNWHRHFVFQNLKKPKAFCVHTKSVDRMQTYFYELNVPAMHMYTSNSWCSSFIFLAFFDKINKSSNTWLSFVGLFVRDLYHNEGKIVLHNNSFRYYNNEVDWRKKRQVMTFIIIPSPF